MPISRSILERCTDWYATRRRADRGLDVPCNTGCLAYEPGTERGCRFVNRGVRVPRPAPLPLSSQVSPRRGGGELVTPGQQDLWVLPTPDMMQEPGATGTPEQENER